MAGTLFVVATPIGHLDDMTARAIKVLRSVALVAAEDTRRTGNLLRHFEISTRLLSLHAHNERSRAAELVARLRRGESVALVSDAGTPGIADPGADLVRLAREAGVRIEAVPGPSAVAAAISVAGLSEPAFAFLGFPPIKSKDRNAWFERLARFHPESAVVFYEAPHRIERTLNELDNLVKCQIIVCRELTKLYEETLQGTPGELARQLASPQGEFTVVVPRNEIVENKQVKVSDDRLRLELGQLIENGAPSRREAARTLAQRYGMSTRQVYDATRDHDGPSRD